MSHKYVRLRQNCVVLYKLEVVLDGICFEVDLKIGGDSFDADLVYYVGYSGEEKKPNANFNPPQRNRILLKSMCHSAHHLASALPLKSYKLGWRNQFCQKPTPKETKIVRSG